MDQEAARVAKSRLLRLWPHLNERSRRLNAATEAIPLGYGGIAFISRICGLSQVTIIKGIKELKKKPLPEGRIRRVGGGRSTIRKRDPKIVSMIDRIVDSSKRGDPENPLLWTCKSTRSIARVLKAWKHPISHESVAQILKEENYSLQGNRKTKEGKDHKDRDRQFRYISEQVKAATEQGQPVISVDTKKKELIGEYHNHGRKWRESKSPEHVQGHDFPKKEVPRAYPYGIYDIQKNRGFVNIGTDHDTGEFAVASIKGWWRHEGKRLYPKSTQLLITADGGGSNGYRLRLWKLELQKLADWSGLEIMVCHFPPGTSKWNKIEHRLFSFISSNWRGEPLRDYETIVKLISNTTTTKGLKVTCRLDHRKYATGKKIHKREMEQVNLIQQPFHGEWNYIIRPSAISK
jgi:hypothetical protein